MKRSILTIGMIILFILSVLTPLSIGYCVIKYPSSIINESNNLYIDSSGSPPVANFTIQNDSEIGIVTFDGTMSYDLDGEIVYYEWDYGDGTISYGVYGWNQYCSIDTYDVTLTVTDNDGLKGNLTKSVFVILSNIPPPVTEIDGPPSGNIGIEYEYTFRICYTDDAIFYLLVDWGDGNNSSWIGPYFEFDSIVLTHSWSEIGNYNIRAKAKDFCREGSWAEFTVTIPRILVIQNTMFQWFLEQYRLLNKLTTFFIK